MIATLYDAATCTVCPGNSTYQLAYNPVKDIESATDSDYWHINKISPTEHTFHNILYMSNFKQGIYY